MEIVNMPFCCTSAVLGSFGEHGEHSVVSVKEVERLLKTRLGVVDLGGEQREGHKRYVIATSVDPKNIRILRQADFSIIDSYEGIQGRVFVLGRAL